MSSEDFDEVLKKLMEGLDSLAPKSCVNYTLKVNFKDCTNNYYFDKDGQLVQENSAVPSAKNDQAIKEKDPEVPKAGGSQLSKAFSPGKNFRHGRFYLF